MHTHTRVLSLSLSLTHTHTHARTHACTHTLSLSLSHTHTNARTHARTHAHTLSLTHTHTCTHTHALSLTHTHTHVMHVFRTFLLNNLIEQYISVHYYSKSGSVVNRLSGEVIQDIIMIKWLSPFGSNISLLIVFILDEKNRVMAEMAKAMRPSIVRLDYQVKQSKKKKVRTLPS